MKLTEMYNARLKGFKESYVFQFGRLCSFPITYLFYHTPIGPNTVTFFGFIINVLAAYLIYANKLILGGVLVWFGLVLDFSDGEISRLKKMQSKFGAWFDGTLDRIGDIVILGAIVVNVLMKNPSFHVLILSLMAFISTTLWRFLAIINKNSFGIIETKKDMPMIGYDVAMHALLIAVAAIFNQLFLLVVFFGIVLNLASLKNVISSIIKYQKF